MTHQRLPPWLKRRLPRAASYSRIQSLTYGKGLCTVCREARCPNQGECFECGTATFLILGDTCTRDCKFCAVKSGRPAPPDPDEPQRVAESVVELGLRHAVITSVTRDDLADGGSQAFAATVRAVRRADPRITVEVLVPDFQGSADALQTVIDSAPTVINHNLETVRRLYPVLRSAASYERSLELLDRVHEWASGIMTKSGIMVGAGERPDEIEELVKDLVGVGCLVLTIGQYLRPTPQHHPVQRYVSPQEFDDLRNLALSSGMSEVVAGPLVRSSYAAGKLVDRLDGAEH